MKCTPYDSSDEWIDDANQKDERALEDGARIKEYKETQTLSDGSMVSKSRISRTYASQGKQEQALIKSITTSIKRTDASGIDISTTTVKELITAPNIIEAEPNTTETQYLPDESNIITTKTSNILPDGSLSTVVTKVHVNKKSSLHNHTPTSCPHPSRPELLSARDSPDIDVLYSNQAIIKPKNRNQATSGIEMISADDAAAVPPASSQDVKDSGIRSKVERSKQSGFIPTSRIETTDNETWETKTDASINENANADVDNEPTRSTAPSDQIEPEEVHIIQASAHRASDMSIVVTHNRKEIFIPEAYAVDQDENIPRASIIEASKFTVIVNGWKVPTCILIVIGAVIGAIFAALVIKVSLSKATAASREQIEHKIETGVLQRNATFDEMNSTDPRLMALNWIQYEDELRLNASSPNLSGRYVLALLAYSFNSSEWTYCGESLNNTNSSAHGSTDHWFCDAPSIDEANANETYVWLSGTDECSWYGVSCEDEQVQSLQLDKNNLVGNIPPELSVLQSLYKLDLGNNCISGTLPPEIGNMSNLQEIDMELNELNGYISDEIFNLTALVSLNLASQGKGNQCTRQSNASDISSGLEGAILEQFWRFENLTTIIINENAFSGSIAQEIGNLQQLGELCLDSLLI